MSIERIPITITPKRKSIAPIEKSSDEIVIPEEVAAGEVPVVSSEYLDYAQQVQQESMVSGYQDTPITKVQIKFKPFTPADLIPNFEYDLGVDTNESASKLKGMLEAFVIQNGDFSTMGINPSNVTEVEFYTRGFKNAIALVNLWIDSMNIIK